MPAVGEVDAGDPVRAGRPTQRPILTGQARDNGAADQRRPVGHVRRGHHGAEPLAQLYRQWRRRGLDDGDVEPEFACRRRDLGADESGSDDDHPGTGPQILAQRECVVDGPDHVDAGQFVTAGPPPRPRTGGQYDTVGVDSRSVGEFDCAASRVESRRWCSEQPGGVEVVVVALQGEVGFGHVADEEPLRQGWAVVGTPRLVADDREPPVETLGAESPCGRQSGQRRSDDRNVLHRFAPSPRRARMSGGRFGLSVLSSTRMRPSSIATT